MAIICRRCHQDIDEKGQDNMSYTKHPKCEDCYDEIQQQSSRIDGCPDDCSVCSSCVYDNMTLEEMTT